ncbi:MAG: sirohydrochlorin cobaltochelatase [Parasporobacterium sp.]|nr:sirohydrochlorin cobaltochelatase [Parasporobacterium sp.]
MKNTKALLVISFGTTFPETRSRTIEAIETDLQTAFPDRIFYRAFTSGMVRKKILEQEGLRILSVPEALEQMQSDGIRDLLVQPTHLLEGAEYASTLDVIRDRSDLFDQVRIGRCLMTDQGDIEAMADCLERIFGSLDPGQMLALMGHGSGRISLPVYDLLNRQFEMDGFSVYCVGTVEFDPGIRPVMEKVRQKMPEEVILSPLLVVAGDHAVHDMAGSSEDSWKSRIRQMGPRVVCNLKGLGEYQEIRDLYVEHALQAERIESRRP